MGQETKRDEALKYSLVDVDNGTIDIPFGGEGLGINGASGIDLLHQFLLGIMKRTWRNMRKLLEKQNDVAKRTAELDSRFNRFKSRHPGRSTWCKTPTPMYCSLT